MKTGEDRGIAKIRDLMTRGWGKKVDSFYTSLKILAMFCPSFLTLESQ